VKISRLLLLLSFSFATCATGQTLPAAGGSPAVSAVVLLKTNLSSKGSTQGQVVKATLEKPLVLPGGINLRKGTDLYGHIAEVSAHSKARPNGALLLVFDEARPKDGPAVPLLVEIRRLAPAGAEPAEALPGARLGGTSNSGGTQQMQLDNNDHGEIRLNTRESDIRGVYLRNSAGGSGTIFSLGEDVYLDSGMKMDVLVACMPHKTE
jgi:hypothetical protein